MQTGMAVALVAAGLTAVLVVRYLLSPSLGSADPGTILLMLAAIGVAPAPVAASAKGRSARERASLVSLGLVPAAAATLLFAEPRFEPIWPIVLVAILLGWYLLPLERVAALAGTVAEARPVDRTARTGGPGAPAVTVHETIVPAGFRDPLTIALFALVVLIRALQPGGRRSRSSG